MRIIGRSFCMVSLLALEFLGVLVLLHWVAQEFLIFRLCFYGLSYGVALRLIQSSEEPAFKIGWL